MRKLFKNTEDEITKVNRHVKSLVAAKGDNATKLQMDIKFYNEIDKPQNGALTYFMVDLHIHRGA